MKTADIIASKIDIKQYYDTYIRPLNEKRFSKPFTGETLAVCPLHNDHDPSMGVVRDKRNKHIQRYHCFGCGKSGNVVTLNQLINQMYRNTVMNYEQSAEDLRNKYGITLTEAEQTQAEQGYLSELEQASRNTRSILTDPTHMSPRSYTRNFRKILALAQDGGTLADIKYNIDALNIKYKQSLLDEEARNQQ